MTELKKLARYLMERVARLDRQTVWEELSVVLMDDAGIEQVNQKFLGRSLATDILSFRYPSGYGETTPCPARPEPSGRAGGHKRASGEVIVNVERAIAEGPKHGGASMELALYLAHGCDHLSGADDNTIKSRRRMRLRELRWLRNARESHGLIQILRKERGGGKSRNS